MEKKMKEKFLITLLFLMAFSLPTWAQATPQRPGPTRQPVGGTTEGKQWEYLVVSFGKVYFSDPVSETDIKTSGLSKLVSFSKAGIVIA